MVNMTQQEIVYRTVPVARKLVPRHAVPPIGIETAVREVGELREEVENAFPDYVPDHLRGDISQ